MTSNSLKSHTNSKLDPYTHWYYNVYMIKKLVRHGNSLALVLDKPILDLLKIQEDTPLEISTEDGRTLKIVPTSPVERQKRVKAAMKDSQKRFSKTLKNLAK